MTIDAPTDGDVFQAVTEQVLVPALRPGDVVVMDNLGAHRREEVAAAIARAGARAEYLPAYSPDLNPIEKMWSKIKEFLRAAKARTSDALDTAIEAAFLSVTSQDAASWFDSCGYTIMQYALDGIRERLARRIRPTPNPRFWLVAGRGVPAESGCFQQMSGHTIPENVLRILDRAVAPHRLEFRFAKSHLGQQFPQ